MTVTEKLRAHAGVHRHPPVAPPHRRSWPRASALAWLLLAAPNAPLAAQNLLLTLGDSARVQIAPGSKVTVPLSVNLSTAAGTTLASLQGRVTWAASQLTLDSVRATGNAGWTVLSNLDSVAQGTAGIVTYGAGALDASGPIGTFYFTAAATNGGTRMTFTPIAAGNESGQSVLAQLQLRPLDACVAPNSKWGDANDDGAVNVIDAQQIARASIGLSVANTTALVARGDVTGDGLVNVLDAQQITRYSVSLSAAARIGTLLYPPIAVASLAIRPAQGTVGLGGVLQLTAEPRDTNGASVAGCPVITWSGASPTMATVSASGLVTGVTLGSTSISASSGTATASTAITIALPAGMRLGASIAVGSGQTCALSSVRTPYCWGYNYYGELGISSATPYSAVPVPVSGGLPSLTALAVNQGEVSCALTASGAAHCWGAGYGSVPMKVSSGVAFTTIAGSGGSICALTNSGAAYCWGGNRYGSVPVPVADGYTFSAMTGGDSYTCALTAAGVAYCWGLNDVGQLGNNSTADSSVPVPVSGGLVFRAISATRQHTCGVTTSGAAYCWGLNTWGQLGNNSTTTSRVPVLVAGGLSLSVIAAGTYHTCALSSIGQAFCWGKNENGELGINSAATQMLSPSGVSGGLSFKEIGAGVFHTCALTTDGAAYCWGGNGYGRLGNNSTAFKSVVPVPVYGGLTFAAITAEGSTALGFPLNATYRMTRPWADF